MKWADLRWAVPMIRPKPGPNQAQNKRPTKYKVGPWADLRWALPMIRPKIKSPQSTSLAWVLSFMRLRIYVLLHSQSTESFFLFPNSNSTIVSVSPFYMASSSQFHNFSSISPHPSIRHRNPPIFPHSQFLPPNSLKLKKQSLFSNSQIRKLTARGSPSFPLVYAAQNNFLRGTLHFLSYFLLCFIFCGF